MNSTNVDEAFLSLTQTVKKRLIDSQQHQENKESVITLQSSAYERLKSTCCFGGGSNGENEGSDAKYQTSEPPKSPTRSVRSNRSGGRNSSPGSPK